MKHLSTLKPYLVNAFYTWSMDINKNPLIEIVQHPKNIIPKELEQTESFILNIHPDATLNMILSKDNMKFEALFSGNNFHITIHYESIKQIFCKEDGYGLEFEIDFEKINNPQLSNEIKPIKQKGHLSLIKND